MNTPPSVTSDDEATLLRKKKIPFLERQLCEALKRLEQLDKEKATLPAQETDPPKNGASASHAA